MFRSGLAAVLCVAIAAFAQGAPSYAQETASPELTLIESLIALQGRASDGGPALAARISGLLKDYDREAPREGRAERYVSALIEMNLLAPEDAAAFTDEVLSLDAAGPRQDGSSEAQELAAISSRYLRFPAGHAFDAARATCDLMLGGMAVVIAGWVVIAATPDLSLGLELYVGGFTVAMSGLGASAFIPLKCF